MMNTMIAAMRTGSNHAYSAGKNNVQGIHYGLIKTRGQKGGSA
jgi:hypothetical protein